MTDKPYDARQFCRDRNIRIASCVRAERNPNSSESDWGRGAHHYLVTLARGKRAMAVPFSMGSGLRDSNGAPRQPTAADVLDCLANDAASVDNARDFEDWASELGMDPDSRAERTYRAVLEQRETLEDFLGEELYQELLYQVERL